MAIKITCAACAKIMEFELGATKRCPHCGGKFWVQPILDASGEAVTEMFLNMHVDESDEAAP
jgi:hypothetical protein